MEAVGMGASSRLLRIPCLVEYRERRHRQRTWQQFIHSPGNVCLQFPPVPEVTGGHVPHVILQNLASKEVVVVTWH